MIKIVENDIEKQDALTIRKTVFVEEQGVPLEAEIDEFEEISKHIILYHEAEPAAVGRYRTYHNGYAKVERVAVLKPYRKYGYGKEVMDFINLKAKEDGFLGTVLNGQSHAKGFYEKLGYITEGEEFLEENIPHYHMKLTFS
ncbi:MULTISPECIES: GNAT family N-acetyltransferase [Mammaliicoccus]|uniref:GNAT family N-acetyltransferase n=1 Tax=Mammaliicoccus TaxID=2803850 RepID=UPI000E02365B|nr:MULTISPECIES: GNAT family N-acetyltransferase [Mammaliicoccus]RTX87102.1 GNAT family N-acetyltransferase [Mammaliicoccus fleurettii]SUM37130.1 acetyltransferase [Mammaliicoccus fleurettii]HCN59955.1 GNAT family N-acetyltransferase [Staphylococcus sp.]